ncbi:MAG: CotH kinase family protein, partial [Oscillospiraceae bacterium]|nr:CotH kinase family protein [Oscillospiraceae bacterium]
MYNINKITSYILCLSFVCGIFSGCSAASSESGSVQSSTVTDSSMLVSDTSSSEYASKLFSDDVIKIDITASDDDWNNLLENAVSKPTIQADISINGETFKNVGVKTKGNTSLSQISGSDSDRYSLKVNFGKYVDGQTCYGLDKLVLNNIYADSTYLKEYMSYDLFAYMGVPASLCTFADIYVNGEHFGFYLALEDVESGFLDRNYGQSGEVEAYKPEGMNMGAGMGGMDKQQNFNPDSNTADDSLTDSGSQDNSTSSQGANGMQTPPDGQMPDGMQIPA